MKPMAMPASDAGDHPEKGAGDAEPARGGIPDPGAHDRAEDELALTTDVEQAHPKREDDREPGEDEWGGLLQGAGHPAVGDERLGQQGLVRVPRADALETG